MATITCTRCGQERDQIAFQPFPNERGRRIYSEICAVCWAEWLNHQKQLINHYALNLLDPKAKQFLLENMQRYLFEGDRESEIGIGGTPPS